MSFRRILWHSLSNKLDNFFSFSFIHKQNEKKSFQEENRALHVTVKNAKDEENFINKKRSCEAKFMSFKNKFLVFHWRCSNCEVQLLRGYFFATAGGVLAKPTSDFEREICENDRHRNLFSFIFFPVIKISTNCGPLNRYNKKKLFHCRCDNRQRRRKAFVGENNELRQRVNLSQSDTRIVLNDFLHEIKV